MNITYFVYGLILLSLAVMGAYRLDVEGVNASEGRRWWNDSVGPFQRVEEGFAPSAPSAPSSPSSPSSQEKEVSTAILDFPPGKPAPVALYDKNPFHLLSDRLAPVMEGTGALSCVTSRSCYATDAEAYLSRVGNYRQLTNNYKHEYPDSCSAPRQELVLGFYEANPLTVSRSGA